MIKHYVVVILLLSLSTILNGKLIYAFAIVRHGALYPKNGLL
jgi:hypothetical protein